MASKEEKSIAAAVTTATASAAGSLHQQELGPQQADALGRMGLYSGNLHPRSHLPHGVGTMEYNEDDEDCRGMKYTGIWEHGHWKRGTLANIHGCGDVYKGEFELSQKHGRGEYRWSDGRKYLGSYRNDVRDGAGEYIWPNGNFYVGAFAENQRHGIGEYVIPKVSRFRGTFEHGQYHRGIQEHFQTGLIYKGEFQNNLPHGRGVEYNGSTGRIRHHGLWENGQPVPASASSDRNQSIHEATSPSLSLEVVMDRVYFDHGIAVHYRGLWNTTQNQPHGNGLAIYKEGPIVSYEGCYDHGAKFHGHGRLLYRNGDSYEGEFQENLKHGTGMFRWNDGRQYTGEYRNNQRHGRGVYVFPNGDRYEGEFEHNQRHGKGKFVFANGAFYDGEWKNSEYHGQGTAVDPYGVTVTGTFERGRTHGLAKEVDSQGNIRFEGQWIRGVKQDGKQQQRRKPTRSKQSEDEDDEDSKPPPPPTFLFSSHNFMQNAIAPAPVAPPPPPPKEQPDPGPECKAVVDYDTKDSLQCSGTYTGIIRVDTGLPHGVGRMVYHDGKRIHEGFWENGAKQGHGRCLFIPQYDYHEGEYRQNLRHGPGRYQWNDGRRYFGEYENDTRHGHGVFCYPNGDKYEGRFDRGQRSGYGRFEFVEPKNAPGENGVTMGWYEGEWSLGKYHGRGKIVWGSTGESYEGEFAHGQRHGRGIQKDAEGNILQQGEWAQNILVRDEILENEPPPPLMPQSEIMKEMDGDNTAFSPDGEDAPKHGEFSVEMAEKDVCNEHDNIETDAAHHLKKDAVSASSSGQHEGKDSGQEFNITLKNFASVTLD
jgi:hypothetical protein